MCSDKQATLSPTYRPTYFPTYSPTSAPTSMPTYTPTTEAPTAAPTSFLPEIILVPHPQPTSAETADESYVVQSDPTAPTTVPKKPEGHHRPMIMRPSLAPSKATILVHGEGNVDADSFEDIQAKMGEGPTATVVILFASFLAVSVSCCACVCMRWNQRRLDEKKRNLRLLQFNASSQVKIYMQDPV